MRKRYLVISGVFVVVGLASLAGVALAGSEEDLAAIKKVREAEAASLAKADAGMAAAVYAAGVELLPPDEPARKGAEAAREWFQAMLDQYDGTLEYTSAEVKLLGDWAIEQYAGVVTLTPKAGGETVVEHPKGIHIYHRGEDGTWRITHDIWNYGPPPE